MNVESEPQNPERKCCFEQDKGKTKRLYTVLFLLNKLKAPKKSEKLKTGASVSLRTFKTYLKFHEQIVTEPKTKSTTNPYKYISWYSGIQTTQAIRTGFLIILILCLTRWWWCQMANKSPNLNHQGILFLGPSHIFGKARLDWEESGALMAIRQKKPHKDRAMIVGVVTLSPNMKSSEVSGVAGDTE